MTFKTEQEKFWAGDFGDDYTERNNSAKIVAGNMALFNAVLRGKSAPKTVIEFGANRGMNLAALQVILPEASFTALEINSTAISELKKIARVEPIQTSILDYEPKKLFDLAFIKGVLIHINPDELVHVYKKLYNSSKRYILLAEYYNPSPVAIPYRGHEERLFKRDFAGEMMDLYKDLVLIDYGFCYHRDPIFPLDDITWFLLEKKL